MERYETAREGYGRYEKKLSQLKKEVVRGSESLKRKQQRIEELDSEIAVKESFLNQVEREIEENKEQSRELSSLIRKQKAKLADFPQIDDIIEEYYRREVEAIQKDQERMIWNMIKEFY